MFFKEKDYSLSLSVFLYLSVSLPLCLCLSVCLSFIVIPLCVSLMSLFLRLSLDLPYLPVSFCIPQSLCVCLSLFVCLCIHLFLCLPACLSLSLYHCLSVSLPPTPHTVSAKTHPVQPSLTLHSYSGCLGCHVVCGHGRCQQTAVCNCLVCQELAGTWAWTGARLRPWKQHCLQTKGNHLLMFVPPNHYHHHHSEPHPEIDICGVPNPFTQT